uniref:Chondroitin proteoglycan 4 domain-containing protein n=1 Tax=Panagrellus redivivus TaxID=6233 RepID=A0A7E4VT54_PANRE
MASAISFVILVAVSCATVARTHPIHHRHFTDQVSKDKCLAKCMLPVTDYGEELSILKNTDLAYYFEKHDTICGIINTARLCIEACGIQSNPFAMEHMIGHCTPDAIQRVRHVHKCLKTTESRIHSDCERSCGNHKLVNDAAHNLTVKLSTSETNYTAEEVDPIIAHMGNACTIYTCMARCNVAGVRNYCGAGEAESLQGLIQYILDAHRRDLERHRVLEQFAHQTPPPCSYMYQPQILFFGMGHENKQQSVSNQIHQQDPIQRQTYQKPQNTDDTKLQILLKQLEVLLRQEKLLEKQNEKLDLEVSLLSRKLPAGQETPFRA